MSHLSKQLKLVLELARLTIRENLPDYMLLTNSKLTIAENLPNYMLKTLLIEVIAH